MLSKNNYLLSILLSIFIFLSSIFAFPQIAKAQIPSNCYLNQETFGFAMKNYEIQHQAHVIINIYVDYRFFEIEEIDPNNYPDVIPIIQQIDKFLTSYPNETDYWEIVNRNLVTYLLEENTDFTSIRVKLELKNNPLDNFYDTYSTVLKTRDNSCPLI